MPAFDLIEYRVQQEQDILLLRAVLYAPRAIVMAVETICLTLVVAVSCKGKEESGRIEVAVCSVQDAFIIWPGLWQNGRGVMDTVISDTEADVGA